jgi:heme-binding NEAT domain protein
MKALTVFTLLFVLLGSVQVPPASAEGTTLADGEYTIDFTVLKEDASGTSMMDQYTKKPAKVTVTEGTYTIDVTLLNSDWIQAFQIQNEEDEYIDAEVISTDSAANERVVRLVVSDLTSLVNVYTHVVVPGISYDHWYYVKFQFDVSSLTPVSDDDDDDDIEQYSLPFTVLKDGTDTPSSMQNYVVSPATLTIRDGKTYVSFTLKSSSLVPVLKYEKDGEYVDSAVVSTDEANDTRVVEFEVDQLFRKLNVYLEVNAGSFGIMKHTVQFQFDIENIPLPIHYVIYKNGTNEVSSMEKYTVKPAILTVRDGINYISFTLKDSDKIPVLRYEKNGGYVDADVISTDETANTRVVEIEVPDLEQKINVYLEVIAGPMGTMQHTVQFKFGNITTGNPGDSEENPNNPDDNPGKDEDGNDNGNNNPGNNNPGNNNPDDDELADGTYYIDYKFLKYGTNETSVMQQYVVTPALLKVKGSSMDVYMTFTQAKEITDFRVSGRSVSIHAENPQENTKVVSFFVDDLSRTLDAWVKIEWPEYKYFHDYDVNLKFYPDSIEKVKDNAKVPGFNKPSKEESSKSEENSTSNNGTNETTQEGTAGGTENGAGSPQSAVQVKGTAPRETAVSKVNFTDIASHWAEAQIARAVTLGFVSGYPDGSFNPNGRVNRAELAVMISRALNFGGNAESLGFADENEIPAWARPYVAQAVNNGLLVGYPDQSFRPGKEVTRAEIVVMIVRALNLPVNENAALPFADADRIPAWARPYVAAAYEHGIVYGRVNNTFAPADPVTRAEAVAMILRMLDHLNAAQAQ